MDTVLKVEGIRPVERMLARLDRRFGNLLPLMDRIGELLVSNTKHRFETSRGPDGRSWKPSERVVSGAVPQEGKGMGPVGGKTLVIDGHLRDSITHLATSRNVEVGSNLIYARIHQLGGTIVPKAAPALSFKLPDGELVHIMKVVIPARPYLGIDAVDVAGIERLADQFAEASA